MARHAVVHRGLPGVERVLDRVPMQECLADHVAPHTGIANDLVSMITGISVAGDLVRAATYEHVHLWASVRSEVRGPPRDLAQHIVGVTPPVVALRTYLGGAVVLQPRDLCIARRVGKRVRHLLSV